MNKKQIVSSALLVVAGLVMVASGFMREAFYSWLSGLHVIGFGVYTLARRAS
ncbi:hypothetical protein [Dyella sp. 20L07]|uniref:hypothetical protein n=1 Tax=Dyella sp. 20L07 TaxID=3384240 RepID=UPI003D2661F8